MQRRGPIIGDRTPAATWFKRSGTLEPGEFGKLVRDVPQITREAVMDLARNDAKLPCRQDPLAWTTPPGQDRENPATALFRMQYVLEGCARCPAFVMCDDLVFTLDRHAPEVTGVLAGRILSDGVIAQRIREDLGVPGWP